MNRDFCCAIQSNSSFGRPLWPFVRGKYVACDIRGMKSRHFPASEWQPNAAASLDARARSQCAYDGLAF